MNSKQIIVVIILCAVFGCPGHLAQAIGVDPLALDPANPGLLRDGRPLMAKPPWIDAPPEIPAGGWRATHNILLICIRFSDQAGSYTAGSFNSLAFGPWTPFSMYDYFDEVSYGNLQLAGATVGWYTAANTRAHYGNNQQGWGAYPQNTAALVEEAVDAAELAGVDFSQYDNDGDGVAESIFVVHSGQGHETSLDLNDIHSHYSTITGMGGTARSYDGMTINNYICVPELQGAGSPGPQVRIGVFCHEFGHLLGLPDLNDTGVYCGPPMNTLSSGIGVWGLMGYGGWGGTAANPEQPTHLCAWSKIRLGWISPTIVGAPVTGQLLQRIEDNPVVLKIGMDWRSTEYILVSYRDDSYGFDSMLPGGGVLIWHVDEEITTGNDCEDSPCSSGSHYLVSLEQPDGNYDLDCSAFMPYGDSGDIYPFGGADSFTSASTPSSDRHDGSASGVSITNIAASGSDMQLDIQPGELWAYLAYDDGSIETGWNWAEGYGWAVRMTPPVHPFDLKGVHIHQNTGNCQYQIWSDSGGVPGSPLTSVLTSTGATGYSWDYEDISALNIQISSGDFWVLYIIHNASNIGSDTSSTWNGRTMYYAGGTFYADSGAYGNYGLRAIGFVGSLAVNTVSCTFNCTPATGTVPFSTSMQVTLTNNYAGMTRQIAGRIDASLGNGTSVSNWKSGYTNVGPGGSFATGWTQYVPALARVLGSNQFQLIVEDVTPTPYNQPPYPPAGNTATDSCTVFAHQ